MNGGRGRDGEERQRRWHKIPANVAGALRGSLALLCFLQKQLRASAPTLKANLPQHRTWVIREQNARLIDNFRRTYAAIARNCSRVPLWTAVGSHTRNTPH